MTKVDRVGPMVKGKTPPLGEDKHGFYKRGLKGRVVVGRCSGLDLSLKGGRIFVTLR